MKRICLAAAGLSLILSGAIFGFFYAWVCSTMWGLDAADPRIAIAAMQAMNGSVRNAVFAPAFFATPVVLALTGLLALRLKARGAGVAFLAGGLLYFLGGLVLTMRFNVPMNEALALVSVPDNIEEARAIWQPYSPLADLQPDTNGGQRSDPHRHRLRHMASGARPAWKVRSEPFLRSLSARRNEKAPKR